MRGGNPELDAAVSCLFAFLLGALLGLVVAMAAHSAAVRRDGACPAAPQKAGNEEGD